MPILQGWIVLIASLSIPSYIRYTLLSSPLSQEVNLPIVYPACDLDYRYKLFLYTFLGVVIGNAPTQ